MCCWAVAPSGYPACGPEESIEAAIHTTDRHRQRVYDAEARVGDQLDFARRGARTVQVHGSTLTLAPDARFASLDSAQRWIDEVRARPGFAARWPQAAHRRVVLRPRRGQARAHYEATADGGVIAVPVPRGAGGWAMRELVLAHELAHHVVACDTGPAHGAEPAHGPAFTAAMVDVVEVTLGPEVKLVLAAAYHDAGVPIAASAPRGDVAAPAARSSTAGR